MKIYLSTLTPHYMALFPGSEEVEHIKEADLVVFTGGADVAPAYYRTRRYYNTSTNYSRDEAEISMYFEARALGKPMLGICRGAQLLTVASGGSLIQDVNNHGIAGTHKLYFTDRSKPIQITSTHHQMMYPYNLPEENYELIAYSPKRSTRYEFGNGFSLKDIGKEPEIVYYTKTNALCIQGHPEKMTDNIETMKKIRGLIKTKLNVKFNVLSKRQPSSLSLA